MNPLKNKALKKTANIMSLAFLATLPSAVYAKEYNVEYAGNNITICHHPSSNDPVTQSIDPNDWVDHKGHGDIPGACGILADEGDFSDKPVFYALSDDTDTMNVYTFGSSDVIPASGDKFPDELENLTEAQGGTYYALTSKSGGAASLYEITMKQRG